MNRWFEPNRQAGKAKKTKYLLNKNRMMGKLKTLTWCGKTKHNGHTTIQAVDSTVI